MIERVITGGQTGADQGRLRASRRSPTPAGWTPNGALTDEQRALIGPGDKVVGLIVPPSKRRRDRVADGS